MSTVTLGYHTFQVGPEVTKRRSLLIGVLEILDGTDKVHIMGRTNKEISLGTIELDKTQFEILRLAYESEEELDLNIPSFEEGKKCRISRFEVKQTFGFPEQTVFEVDVQVVLTE